MNKTRSLLYRYLGLILFVVACSLFFWRFWIVQLEVLPRLLLLASRLAIPLILLGVVYLLVRALVQRAERHDA